MGDFVWYNAVDNKIVFVEFYMNATLHWRLEQIEFMNRLGYCEEPGFIYLGEL